MPPYYRIIHEKHRSNPLGYGQMAARWNSKGVGIIYCANTISLVHTEWLSIKGPAVIDSLWLLVTLEIDNDIFTVEIQDLPKNWCQIPPINETRKIGDIWSKELISLGLKVPSARLPIIAFPEEHNLLLNPNHPNFHKRVNLKRLTELNFNLNKWSN